MNRKGTVESSVMSLVSHFVSVIAVNPLAPTEDELLQSADQVDQISYELLTNHLSSLLGYERGNVRCKADLISEVNGMDETTFPFMNAAAKLVLTNKLNQIT
jgi:hypothetical protein